jgi:iron-sulfur cluster assembly protein
MQSETLSPSETGTAAAAAPGPSKKTVTITDGAVEYAKKRLAQRGTPDAAIRLGVRGGGCSGFSYVIEFADDPPKERDLVFDAGGVRFYVDKKSFVYLAGSALDYEKTLVFSGFKFKNPQEASRCGCGHSFTVR